MSCSWRYGIAGVGVFVHILLFIFRDAPTKYVVYTAHKTPKPRKTVTVAIYAPLSVSISCLISNGFADQWNISRCCVANHFGGKHVKRNGRKYTVDDAPDPCVIGVDGKTCVT